MFIIIIVWGSRERKIKAGYLFFLYTLVGSFCFLTSIIIIKLELGTTAYDVLLNSNFSYDKQILL
jgi:NADH-ubiquinone oxidoreductase chain 4